MWGGGIPVQIKNATFSWCCWSSTKSRPPLSFFFGTDQLFYSLQIKRAKPSQNVQKNNTIPNGNCKKAFRGPYKKHLGGDSRRGRSGARIRGRPRGVESKKKIHQSSRVRSMVDVKVDTEEDMEVEVDVEEHVGNTWQTKEGSTTTSRRGSTTTTLYVAQSPAIIKPMRRCGQPKDRCSTLHRSTRMNWFVHWTSGSWSGAGASSATRAWEWIRIRVQEVHLSTLLCKSLLGRKE